MANRAQCLAKQDTSVHFGKPECASCHDRLHTMSGDRDGNCDYEYDDVAPIPFVVAVDEALAQLALERAAERDVRRRGVS